MKTFLLSHLICPACLPQEQPLTLTGERREGEEIVAGRLSCRRCRRDYPIRDGIAELVADPSVDGSAQLRYEEMGMVERYLWSHFADLGGVPANGTANAAWSALLAPHSGPALDAGCAVGRLTFELATRSDWTVGCDLSRAFVRAARRLARARRADFTLPLEGQLRENFSIELPSAWRSDNLEFVVADALRLPFPRATFAQGCSLNLLDRVSYPLAHLYELNRVLRPEAARLLLATPFSWGNSPASEERWLGGTTAGDYPGRGADNVRALLEGKNRLLTPPWQIAAAGAVEWRLRSHCNHTELINSHYLCAAR